MVTDPARRDNRKRSIVVFVNNGVMLPMFVAASLLARQDQVELSRTFTTGQTLSYNVKTHLLAEEKNIAMSFFLPQEFDVNYAFTMKVEDAKPDGFATVLYERPTMTFIEGETNEAPPKTTVNKSGWKLRLTLSPINEITDIKDLSEKKKDDKGGKGDKGGGYLFRDGIINKAAQSNFIGKMIQELQSLAMFVGGLDSALDFSPKLPLDDIKPGDTWKKTVSYQPRELKGTEKQAVQRLDYTYTYNGLADAEGKKVHRVTAVLDLDTDAAKFINQAMDTKPEESGLKELRLQMKATIVYDLDEKTKTTLKATAESKGGFSIFVTQSPDQAVVEEKMAGKSVMTLAGIK